VVRQPQLPPHWQLPPDLQPQLQPDPHPQAATIGSRVPDRKDVGGSSGIPLGDVGWAGVSFMTRTLLVRPCLFTE
jgi:hypothetical protein